MDILINWRLGLKAVLLYFAAVLCLGTLKGMRILSRSSYQNLIKMERTKFSCRIFFCLFALIELTNSYKPVVLIHGVMTGRDSMYTIAQRIAEVRIVSAAR